MADYRHSSTTRAVLHSLVPVICPPEAGALGDAIVEHVALTLGASPVMLQRGFAIGLRVYDLGALPGYRSRARSLAGERAERYFASWERGTSPQVQLARGINQLMSLACYEQPEMMERLGYRPAPWIAEVTRRRMTVYRDDVRRQEAQILAPDPLRPNAQIKRGRA
jgi:hypothetical protein